MATVKQGAAALTERRFDAIHLHGPGHRPHRRALRVVALARGGVHDGRRARALPEHPERGDVHDPDPLRVDGHVTATMPLELYGSIIDGIRVEFEGGRAVKIDADENADTLRSACTKDDGALTARRARARRRRRPDRPAARPCSSTRCSTRTRRAISRSAPPTRWPSRTRPRSSASTQSQIHIDFMIGSPELDVDGITAAGEHVPVLRQRRLADLSDVLCTLRVILKGPARGPGHRTGHRGRDARCRLGRGGERLQPLLRVRACSSQSCQSMPCSATCARTASPIVG